MHLKDANYVSERMMYFRLSATFGNKCHLRYGKVHGRDA